jgi:hypothetical protein
MKFAATATLAVFVASQAAAIELGGGLKAGAEIDMNYTTGIEEWALEATPEVGFEAYGADLTVGSTFDLMGLNEDDVFKGLDFEAEYDIGVIPGLTAYGEIGTDADFEFGDATMGVKFAF